MLDKKWSCSACIKTTPEAMRKAKGCHGLTRYTVDRFKVSGCLGNHYSQSIPVLFRAFRAYQLGVMPFQGAYMDQPAKVLEAFSLFEDLEAKRLEKERERNEREATRGR